MSSAIGPQFNQSVLQNNFAPEGSESTSDSIHQKLFCSFVVPVYHDSELCADFCKEFQNVMSSYLGHEDLKSELELIFVNDGELQNTPRILELLATEYPFVKVLNLSRNFGQHIAISCGYAHSIGDYVGMLNVDMQDPPDQIPVLLDKIRSDEFDIVIGTRPKRQSSWFETFTSEIFIKTMNQLTGVSMVSNMATLRICNRKFLNAYTSLTESTRYIPGLESWLGFRQGYHDIQHRPRAKGKSSYTFAKRLLMASDALISFSDVPLKMVVLAGMSLAVFGLVCALALILCHFFVVFQSGWVSLMVILLFFFGVQLFSLGIVGLYVGRILSETQGRPLFIVASSTNFTTHKQHDLTKAI